MPIIFSAYFSDFTNLETLLLGKKDWNLIASHFISLALSINFFAISKLPLWLSPASATIKVFWSEPINLFSIFTIPFGISFKDENETTFTDKMAIYSSIINIFLCVNLAYYEKGILIKDRYRIIKEFLLVHV